jgi:predicted dehydrogenase
VSRPQASRRDFLKVSTAAAAGAVMPYWFTSASPRAFAYQSPNERPVLGCIGTGSRWGQVVNGAMDYSDCVAVCDVDAAHAGKAQERIKKHQGRDVDAFEDYRRILDNESIDVVTIVTPDHWHSKIAIEAMRAGKDIYCEKPLTLTINEGKQIIKVLEETGRVFQVGTQQRTEMGHRFLEAIALIRDGRIGEIKRVTCDIGGSTDSGPIDEAAVPEGLNWELWLGQAPLVPFRSSTSANSSNKEYPASRCHYEFRWWYEYSGGKLTDWGAHHVDIAQWAIGQSGDGQGPLSIEGIAKHPVEFVDGMPVQDDRYNAAIEFDITVMFPGVEMHIVNHSSDGNGILFEGTQGRFHVSRGAMKGRPVEDLKSNPLPEGAIAEVYGGKEPTSHMQNFMDCVKSREVPISDVWSHHRAMTTCHLANIAIRLGRRLEWDPSSQQIVGDDDANMWQGREQRKGYEIDVPV